MKISVLFILIYLSWHSSAKLKPIEDTTKATSTALSDVLKAFFVTPEQSFEVFILGNETTSERDILNDALSKASCVTTIRHAREISWKSKQGLVQSSVFLASEDFLRSITTEFIFNSKFPKEVKMLIYTTNMEPFLVDDYLIDLGSKRKLDTSLYFLHEQPGKIELFTYEWFTKSACNKKVKETLNVFDTKAMAWSQPMNDHKKFRNFHGCQIVALDARGSFFTGDHVTGVAFDILDVVGSRGNFTVYRQLGLSSYHGEVFAFTFKGVRLAPQIIFTVRPIYSDFHSTMAIVDEKISIIINEGELYCSYEKLLFPFDAATWSLLVGTFCAAFGTIVVVNRLPKHIQKLIYGEENYFPAFNVLGTFFGIGQTQLPSANFPRMILMLFIIFCLIIRTAYQGVFFEMMATDMRKPVPETIEELLEQNYTIYCADKTLTLTYVMITIWHEYNLEHALTLYNMNQSHTVLREDEKKVSMIANTQDEMFYRALHGREPLKFKQPIITLFKGLSTFPHHYMFSIINEVVERTIPAGIPQHFSDFDAWDSYLKYTIMKGEAELVSLTLDDLGFGFILWLIACVVSFVAFIFEVLKWGKFKRRWTRKWKIRDGKLRRKVRTKPRVILVGEAEARVKHNTQIVHVEHEKKVVGSLSLQNEENSEH